MQKLARSLQRPGLTLSKSSRAPLKVLCAVIVAVLGLVPVYQATIVDADWRPTVRVLSPTTTTVQQGQLQLAFTVDGLSSDKYEPFWAVGDGTWNRLNNTNGISTGTIDTTSWNWNVSNTYELSFIALQKDGWQPLIQKKVITLKKGAAPQVSVVPSFPTPGQVAVIPANNATPVVTPEVPIVQKTAKTLYVDPESDAQSKAKAWSAAHPEDSAVMNKLISQPLANWYGGWNNDVRAEVDRYVSNATAAGQVPALVAYNIPSRDCGSYSAGGVANRQAYTTWMNEFAAGIGSRNAIVLLEPDALASMDCLSKDGQADRISMIRDSVATLKSKTSAKVYIDAGHPEWLTTSVIANRLKQAGVETADGFSLNVSNFASTEKNITYGKELSRKTNGAHFVVDTSRNGNGSAANLEWCNPSNVKAGANPTLSTGYEVVDAYLWVKAPGGSDGTCGKSQSGTAAPAAGEWWPEYALSILR